MKRDNKIVDLRPIITTVDLELVKSKEEQFQNEVLRPIIKFQHELILLIFNTYLQNKKIDLESISSEKRYDRITSFFQNDRDLVSELKWVIVAYFTSVEYQNYNSMKSDINKRLVQIIKERILSVVLKP
jgi:hypothetical protein|tara:strand:+ start:1314 stop:1700 length:387 start_codon:yes stop_codon:yes gene_type:complete